MSEVARQLGMAIRKHRIAEGWTQCELGRRTGFSQTQISKIERGQVRTDIDEREAFERAFRLRRGELLRDIGRLDEEHPADLLAARVATLEQALAALARIVIDAPSPPTTVGGNGIPANGAKGRWRISESRSPPRPPSPPSRTGAA